MAKTNRTIWNAASLADFGEMFADSEARRTPRGQPEGWIISPEEREALRSIQERVYQFVYFGIKPG